MSNYRRADAPGACYFFTVVTFRRRPILTDDDCRIWLHNAIINTRKRYPFTIDAWVLLPDHLHCIWTLPEGDNDFSVRWNGIKRRFTRAAKHRTAYTNQSGFMPRKKSTEKVLFGKDASGSIKSVMIRITNDIWIISITIRLNMAW